MPAQSGPSSDATAVGEVAWSPDDLRANPHDAADKPQRVERMFTAIARRYDLNNRLHSFGRDQAWRRSVVRFSEVQLADDVLDVACGTGDLTEAFAAVGPRSVTGVDFTEAMLEIAREKSDRCRAKVRSDGKPTPKYLHADAMDLPFEGGSFDIVSIAFGIRNVADMAKALREFRRVLRPGGRLAVLEFSQPGNAIIRRLNSIYCEKIMPCTATLIAGDRSGAYRYLPTSVRTFTSAEAFVGLLRECGFPEVQAHPMTFGVCTVYLARIA